MKAVFTVGMVFLAAVGIRAASAQTTIYKCTTATGTVYSQQPCASSGKHMQKLELKRDAAPDLDDLERARNADKAMTESVRQRELDAQESSCFSNATAQNRGASRRIADYRQQIARLRAGRTGVLNTAGITYDNGIEAQITGLQARIDREQDRISRTIADARELCANERQHADRASAPDRPESGAN